MHPPLRTREDVDACRRGLLDGTIDCIVTDHAPHTAEEKGRGILSAPPGIVGLETAVGVAAKAMIESGLADWPAFVAWFTQGPARVVRRARPGLQPGLQAELSLLDPDSHYRVDASRFRSKCRNTPFSGLELRARAVGTIRGRKVALLPECHVKARF
jgi:dihydroorotase